MTHGQGIILSSRGPHHSSPPAADPPPSSELMRRCHSRMPSPRTALTSRRISVTMNTTSPNQPTIDNETGRGDTLANEEPRRHALTGSLLPLPVNLSEDRAEQDERGRPPDKLLHNCRAPDRARFGGAGGEGTAPTMSSRRTKCGALRGSPHEGPPPPFLSSGTPRPRPPA